MIDFDTEVTRIYQLADKDPANPPSALTMAAILLGPHCVEYATNLPWKAEYNSALRKIFVRKRISWAAKTFAIYHELGEAICHELGYREPDKEQVAHGLGVRLMLPREAWRPAVKATNGSLPALAMKFRTTETVIALRRAEITGLPTAVVAPGFIMIRGEPYMFGQSETQIRRLASGGLRVQGVKVIPLTDSRRTILIAS